MLCRSLRKIYLSAFTSIIFGIVAQPAFAGGYSLAFPVGGEYEFLAIALSASADPQNIQYGESATLNWSAPQAARVFLDGGEVAKSGAQVVAPLQSTTYRFTALDATGQQHVEKDVTVSVIQPDSAEIASFSASAPSVTIGSAFSLSWSSAKAVSATLQGNGLSGAESVPLTGARSITPISIGSHDYTLTVANTKGEVTQQMVSVTVVAAPAFTQALFAPATVRLGESAQLNWTTSGASSVSIAGGAVNPAVAHSATGSLAITPAAVGSQDYTLTAVNALGSSVHRTATLITEYPVPTLSVQSDRASVAVGDPVQLSWSSTDVASVRFLATGQSYGPNSTLTVTPNVAGTIAYNFSATGLDGSTINDSTSVTVVDLPTLTAQASPTSGTVGSNTTISWTGNTSISYVTVSGLGAPGGQQPATGSVTFSIPSAGEQTYTVTATDAFGHTAQDTVTVTGVSAPVLSNVNTSASDITLGDSFQLSWGGSAVDHTTVASTTGSAAPIGPQYASPVTITPTAAQQAGYAYAVTAYNSVGVGAAPQSRTVYVWNAPTLSAVATNKASLTQGTGATLSWTGGGDIFNLTLSGSGAPGSLANSASSATVTPAATGTQTYTLTATNKAGATTSKTIALSVSAGASLTGVSVPGTGYQNTPFTLTATGSSIDHIRIVGSAGSAYAAGVTRADGTGGSASLTEPNAGNYTYTVTAYNALGDASDTQVSSAVAIGTALSAASVPAQIVKATPFTLSLTGVGIDHIAVQATGGTAGSQSSYATQYAYPNGSGTAAITMRESGPADYQGANTYTYQYTVTAFNAGGQVIGSAVTGGSTLVRSFTAINTPASVNAGSAFSLSVTPLSGQTIDHLRVVGSAGSAYAAGVTFAAGTGTSVSLTEPTAGSYSYTVYAYLDGTSTYMTGSAASSTVVINNATAVITGASVNDANPLTGTTFATLTLSWTGTNLASVSYAGAGVSGTCPSSGSSGSCSVYPSVNGAITVTGVNAQAQSGPATSATQSITIRRVNVASVSVSPLNLLVGQSGTLSWVGTNLTGIDYTGSSSGTCASSATGGSCSVVASTYITVKGKNGSVQSSNQPVAAFAVWDNTQAVNPNGTGSTIRYVIRKVGSLYYWYYGGTSYMGSSSTLPVMGSSPYYNSGPSFYAALNTTPITNGTFCTSTNPCYAIVKKL